MLQINRIKKHSPQEGKNKWLILFSAIIASSVPRSDWEGEEVLFFQEAFLSWLYRIVEQRSVLNG